MKKCVCVCLILFGTYLAYSQKETTVLGVVMESYEGYYKLNNEVAPKQEEPKQEESKQEIAKREDPKREEPPRQVTKKEEKKQTAPKPKPQSICPPEPDNFYDFFKTTFIDFRSLREEEKVKSFSFSDSLCAPLNKKMEITSKYGMREGGKHFGIDFRVNIGDPIRSIFCGKVRVAKYDKTYGYVVVVRHYNMSEAVYAHLHKILVSVNQEVTVGQIIGLGGNSGRSSGPHLHFELRYKGFPMNPIINGKFLTLLPVALP
jgi:murein DD-endopeptidase MepM/ murein hydrolase activator NlpD